MATCPYCREIIIGQAGIITACHSCGARLKIFRPSPVRRSIPRVTSTGQPRRRSRSSLGLQPIKTSGSNWIQDLEYKPTARKIKKADKPSAVVNKISHQYQSFSEIDEINKTIIFNLPLDEDQLRWEIEGNILKVKSLRFDYQYKEEVKIPSHWEGQEPKVSFLNGVLSFSWNGNE